MISTGIDQRVKIQDLIENQLPEFLLSESPKAVEFFKQYYASQEFPGGPVDIVENLDQYIKVDNLTPEVIKGNTVLTSDVDSSASVIQVESTKGFPNKYGLLKIDDEIITYTGITANTFTGCIRGFSGITNYHKSDKPDELVFSTSISASHAENSSVENLSALFLKEFYRKLKFFLTPGLEDVDFVQDLDVNNFIKNARSFYQAKGTPESFKVLFNILFGETPKVVDLEQYLLKPSSANFIRREILITEAISGNPLKLIGQTIYSSSNPDNFGSVSEVEILIRNSKLYYKIGLFIGFDDIDQSQINQFKISGKTKVLETTSPGSEIILVDSTIGFPELGTLVSGPNTITYTGKSVNQFFGCSGVEVQIDPTDDIRSDELLYGYEDGNLNKKVEIRITGVISDFLPSRDIVLVDEDELISVKNIGESIQNPESNKTNKQIFANSWIYNTSCRYEILSASLQALTLSSKIEPSSLKVGDTIEILERSTENVVATDLSVFSVSPNINEILVTGVFELQPDRLYDLRRKIKKSSLLFTGEEREVELEYGDNKVTSDIQNLYTDDQVAYVASNSLPEYPLDIDIISASLSFLEDYDDNTQTYSTYVFSSSVPFLTGDTVVYVCDSTPLTGITTTDLYYVEVLNPSNKIRLFSSKSFIGTEEYSSVREIPQNSTGHKFILSRYRSRKISPQKILRKFSLNNDYSKTSDGEVNSGGVGLAVNGVEIISPKSTDKIYYGPLKGLTILNSGEDYDVINPPNLKISSSPNGGTNALGNLVVSGSVKSILVEPQNFDVSDVISVTISGGNGSGAVFEPIISKRFREVEFNTTNILLGGGIDINDETITFTTPHNFENYERITYSSNGYDELGISSFSGANSSPVEYLLNGGSYYARLVNSSTIKLHRTLKDAYSGINTVGFTTSNTTGFHKFRTQPKNTLSDIKVLNSGSGYENRKLRVKASGISTSDHTVTFSNHNFKDGDLVEYNTTGSSIGLSTESSYYILRVDENAFRLAYAGIGTNLTKSNYERRNYELFTSQGSGYHIFKYPDIEVTVNVSFGSSLVGTISATPVIRGSVVDAYLYEPGSGYGSKILNLHKTPIISIENGKNAEVKPIIINGKIVQVEVTSGGSGYVSEPDLIINGDGSGAVIKSVVSNGNLINAIIIKSGSGYSKQKTSIKVSPPGKNLKVNSSVRNLTLNENIRSNTETLIQTSNNLKYCYVGYPMQIARQYFGDVVNPEDPEHSPIIGWAYDGNPIYGPYGYRDPSNSNSDPIPLKSGYVLDSSNINDRPSGFIDGFFVEDYKFDGSGDLDIYNGRFCKTKDFPNGTYAYFVGVSTVNVLEPVYPYFIGNKFRSPYIKDNQNLDQTFDFNNSHLLRNTFPYKVNTPFANNDFLVEPNKTIDQLSKIETVTKGTVDSFTIISSGEDYKVGDLVKFDDTGTNGGGLSAIVSDVEGKDIIKLETAVESYSDVVFTWKDENTLIANILPYHTLLDKNNVNVSGLSTSISKLTGSHNIGVSSNRIVLFSDIPSNTGLVTDVYVSNIQNTISIGSSLQIENEIVKVLNIFPNSSVLRIRRFNVGSSHTISTPVTILPDNFSINLKTKYFDSKINDLVYFNPKQSVGIGTTLGFSVGIAYTIGDLSTEISVPTQSIYLPNHPFKTGQSVSFNRGNASSLQVKETVDGSSFNLPSSTEEQVYIINKSKDYIGITTLVGLTTNTNGLYFITSGDDYYEYSLKSNYEQVTGVVDKIETKVSVSTVHELQNGDLIKLNVFPNLQLGIGNSTSIRVKYDSNYNKILINPLVFSASGINTTTDVININSHGFETGNKVFYKPYGQVASGLQTSGYYVYRIDDDNIQLCKTYLDTQSRYPNTVSIGSTGGSFHELSLINPQIKVIKNNDVIFDLSDSSLDGYDFKIFYDSTLNSEFLSTSENDTFNVNGQGTILFSNELPNVLYYGLQKSGENIKVDYDVKEYSQIYYEQSKYNDTHIAYGIGSTSFNISLKQIPEKLSYVPSECEDLSYTTSSKNANGGISQFKIISKGSNYKKLPIISEIQSENGKNALVLANSNSIGRIAKTKILEQGFEYSSDKTLRPEAYISPTIALKNYSTISSVEIVNGGKNYISPPSLLIIESESREILDEGSLTCETYSGAISNVSVNVQPYGLESIQYEVVAINNTNGVYISTVSSDSNSIRCFLTQPLSGFSTNVFDIGEEVFVENIEKASVDGDGFNSSDYGYRFFTVSGYNFDPPQVILSLSGFSTNPGIAKTVQEKYPTIIKRSNYPEFQPIQTSSVFKIGEQILVKTGSSWVKQDLYITIAKTDYIKVSGSYLLSTDDIIKGSESGSIATIESIVENEGKFDTSYSILQNYGWLSDTGKLNENSQVLPDNDYYQNLSYTVKSPIEFEKSIDSINRLVHTSGLKNFSDTEIKSTSKTGIGSTGSDVIVIDIVQQNRVDSINNFDLGIDIDVNKDFNNYDKTKSIKLKNKRVSSYIDCISNRVLIVDDISDQFLSRGTNTSESGTQFIKLTPLIDTFGRYLIQFVNPNNDERQLTELIILNDNQNAFTLEKSSLTNSSRLLADVEGEVTNFGEKYIKVIPTDIFDTDLDIKVFQDIFTNNLPGIGTYSVGFTDLIGSNTLVSSAKTSTLYSYDINKINSIHLSVQVTDTSTDVMQYVELYVEHDSNDAYFAEYYFDSDIGSYSSHKLGNFNPTIDSGKLKIDFYNTSSSDVLVRTKSVGFGTTSVGNGVYRFKFAGQLDGSERSARLESNYSVSGTSQNIITVDYDNVTSVKSMVRVSYGETSALHQVTMIVDDNDVNTLQYPFLSIGSTSGIGTFGGEFIGGSQAVLKFYPDAEILEDVHIQSFNEVLYTENDSVNQYPDLEFGSVNESIILGRFDAFNGTRINRLNFDMNYNDVPIYTKTFDPSNSDVLDLQTGIFYIRNHFFSNIEKVTYTPRSTFIGVGATALGIAQTSTSSGITTVLPPELYVIKINDDQFKLSTRKDYAQSGIAVSFTSTGSGNAHTLDMSKKLEKTIITIDGVVQKPITFVPINYSLKSTVSTSSTFFALSGISTIKPNNLLKIDDEFVRIVSVGLGETSDGPITATGTVPIVNVQRSYIGSNISSHTIGTSVYLYSGAYNISGNKIYFTDPPTGSGDLLDKTTNLPFPKSSFSGRVYLRDSYATNQIYDDISYQFTGIGQTYTLTVQGVNTTGISTGDGILFINNVFQTPTTSNNSNNNYSFISSNSGISSVVFSGISTLSTSPIVKSETDVNQNLLPRGGIIISLGSTPGLGFAPPVGAKLRAIVGAGGSIVSVTGTSYTGTGRNVSTAFYDNSTGIVEITTTSPHGLSGGDFIKLVGLAFTCPSSAGIVSYFPLSNLSYSYPVSGITSENTFSTFVGYSTLPHTYVGMGTVFPWYNLNFGSGYYGNVSIGLSEVSHNVGLGSTAVIVAKVGAGGTLSFTVSYGGTGYTDPYVQVPQPSYSNLPVVGVSRLGIGSTTKTGENLLITLDVGASSTTGIGSTLFEVKNFKIARQGYGFKKGDVFKPVGLVTAWGLSSPLADFELTVVDTFEDNFYSWQFGEFDYIDSIRFLQNGSRTRFPLYYNGSLRSFEKEDGSPIDLNAVLLVFINGVLQKPGESYLFEGGTSFIFTVPPRPDDNVSIFFYRGTKDVDSIEKTVYETIKVGDIVQLIKGNESSSETYQIFEPTITNINALISVGSTVITGIGTSSLRVGQSIESIIDVIPNNTNIVAIGQSSITINKTTLNSIDLELQINVGTISTAYGSLTQSQDERIVSNIVTSDVIDTNIYSGIGITDLYYRPLLWTKQKIDRIINGDFVYKTRDVLEPRIYPSARVIRTIFSGDEQIFVDDARMFDYEVEKYGSVSLSVKSFDATIVNDTNPQAASLTAVVSTGGTIQALTVVNPGSGYTGSTLEVKIGIPTSIGGIKASAIVKVVDGSVASVDANITNPGLGYVTAPQVIAPLPKFDSETVLNVTSVEGFSGIVTGITTAPGIGTNLALKFFLRADPTHPDSTRQASDFGSFIGLSTNYPIYIYDTNIGSGVTSIDRSNTEIIGIGTTFLDNIYHIHAGTSLNSSDPTATITCNVHSGSPLAGLSTYSTSNSQNEIVGRFSWGRISALTRSSNPISIGISGYTTISGLSTFPTIQRKNYGYRDSGAMDKISENPND
jgi:hypothetical protein